jgi:thioredoxin reductase (NADPH)
MAEKPVILIVDDEAPVLNAVARDLRRHYRDEYRIVQAGSGAAALESVRQLKHRNTPLALYLVDQRMPEMSGTDFLTQARTFYPEARKVLLTAYADTQAAIASINVIGLDYYLLKPWDPPEQNLYPVLDDLLSDWGANATHPYQGIRVVGSQWSVGCHNVKEFLARNQVPYQWLDIEASSEARTLLATVDGGSDRLPIVFTPDGNVLLQPSPRELAESVGLQTQASRPFYDLIIIGAGPAGLGAAVYGASEGLHVLMVEKQATGGQAGTSSKIENYLGFPTGITGADLARRAATQATRFGAEILTAQEVTGVRPEDPYRIVVLSDGSEISCRALLVSSGATVRQLDAPGVERLAGAGIYYGAAMTEAANYREQHVFVVGGANSAGQGAMFFSRYARQVTILVRSTSLEKSMSYYLIKQIEATPNIDVRTRSSVAEAHGSDRLEAITIRDEDTGELHTVPAAAMFLFIGAVPHSEAVAGLVERNNAGFIITGPDLMPDGRHPKGWKLKRDPFLLETSVPGIFAAGDIRHGAIRRVASAVGEGAIAVAIIHQYLKTV